LRDERDDHNPTQCAVRIGARIGRVMIPQHKVFAQTVKTVRTGDDFYFYVAPQRDNDSSA